MIKSLPDVDETLVIAVRDTARVIAAPGQSRASTVEAVDRLEPASNMSDLAMAQAVDIAQAMTGELEHWRLVVYTDQALAELDGQLAQRLQVHCFAEPVANVALLKTQILPIDADRAQLTVALGCWADEPLNVDLQLSRDNHLISQKTIQPAPGTISHYNFALPWADVPHLKVTALCDDGFDADNEIYVADSPNFSAFTSDKAPAALAAFFDADPQSFPVNQPEMADLVVAVIDPGEPFAQTGIYVLRDDSAPGPLEAVRPGEHLFADANRRFSIATDLYVPAGAGLRGLSENALPLLINDNGAVLAALEQAGSQRAVLIAQCMFDDDSHFWKLAQFSEIAQRMVEMVLQSPRPGRARASADYANLWDSPAPRTSTDQPLRPASVFSLFGWLIGGAIALLLIDIIAWYYEVII